MYKSRRRPWVKLYCREWLTSTVRLTLTEEDRSRFIDLLALAGDSKIPGVVCAGYESGQRIGYPLDWLANTMRCTVGELVTSLQKFESQDRVTVRWSRQPESFTESERARKRQKKSQKVTKSQSDLHECSVVVLITGWQKYQSEYLRQIQPFNNKNGSESSPQSDEQTYGSSPHSLRTEVEGDKEKEVEEDKTKNGEAALCVHAKTKDTRHQEFIEFAYKAFQGKFGQKPTWLAKDWTALSNLLKSNFTLELLEFGRRWQNYIESTEAFTVKQGFSLCYFCSKFDTFLHGPLHEKNNSAIGRGLNAIAPDPERSKHKPKRFTE